MPTIREAVRSLQARLFVGRQRELARFQAWLATETPLPEILDVSGPGGVGKTALLGAFRRCAEQNGRPVVLLDGRDLRPTPEGLISALGGTTLPEVLGRLSAQRPL